ncbi:MAG TPA: hypothetical protein VF054_18670 [Micromonosporaceae bacterium]
MSQPEESREKTASTDEVLMHPDDNPDLEIDEVAPRRGAAAGEVRVEQDGELRPIDTDEAT